MVLACALSDVLTLAVVLAGAVALIAFLSFPRS